MHLLKSGSANDTANMQHLHHLNMQHLCHWIFNKICARVAGLCWVMSEGQPRLNCSEPARVLCSCKSSGGINSQCLIRHRAIYWLDEGLKVTFYTVGLKRKFIFTPIYQPDCSSDLWRLPPLLCVHECGLNWTILKLFQHTEERGKEKRGPGSLVTADFIEGLNWILIQG